MKKKYSFFNCYCQQTSSNFRVFLLFNYENFKGSRASYGIGHEVAVLCKSAGSSSCQPHRSGSWFGFQCRWDLNLSLRIPGQRIPWFDRCQLTTTWMSNIKYVGLPQLPKLEYGRHVCQVASVLAQGAFPYSERAWSFDEAEGGGGRERNFFRLTAPAKSSFCTRGQNKPFV